MCAPWPVGERLLSVARWKTSLWPLTARWKYLFIHSDWWLPGSHQVLTLVTGTWLTSLGLLPFWELWCFSPVRKKKKVEILRTVTLKTWKKFKAIVHPPQQRSWGGAFTRPSITLTSSLNTSFCCCSGLQSWMTWNAESSKSRCLLIPRR